MRPLTDNLPKPLLQAGGYALIEYQLKNLARAGFVDIVINHAYLGEMRKCFRNGVLRCEHSLFA